MSGKIGWPMGVGMSKLLESRESRQCEEVKNAAKGMIGRRGPLDTVHSDGLNAVMGALHCMGGVRFMYRPVARENRRAYL